MFKTIIKLVFLFLASSWMLVAAQAQAPRSGYEYLTESTREMQDDEFANPGMVEVEKGRKLFNTPGDNDKTCAICHGENGEKLNPKKIARYPIYNEEFGEPFTLQKQINLCWEDQLDNVPFIDDCVEIVALETFVRHKAKGEIINIDINGPLRPYYEAGKELYNTRFGQLDMACKHCHEYNAGKKLRGQILSQGQSNGFPEYRLGTGRITSLQRRLRECFVSFRATPFDFGAKEWINLEIYLHARGNGLKIETPAVRY
jgi:sulfur-oxidizing protein SoxA